jgi:hypothetical protein
MHGHVVTYLVAKYLVRQIARCEMRSMGLLCISRQKLLNQRIVQE